MSRAFAASVGLIVALSVGTATPASADPPASASAAASSDVEKRFDALLAETADESLRAAYREHRTAVLEALALRPHVEAVAAAVQRSPGKIEFVNRTPEALKRAAGRELPLFDAPILVDLAIPNAGPHAHREVDPYDAAFFQHLGELRTLESLNVIATKLSDDWIAPLSNLTNLKTLRFTNNGKLTDAGLEKLAGLQQLEQFSFVGTKMQGHAFAKFEGWTKLTRSSFRGSSLDDEGLRLLCERFPNYENLSLAHAHFTDAGAAYLAKLTKLKGLEIGSREATPACLAHVARLPLEYLQIGDGLDTPTGVELIKDVPTLRRLTLTNAAPLSDADLELVAGMKQLEQLELGKLPLPDERLAVMEKFSFLKALRLVPAREPFSDATQAKLRSLLPRTEIKFQ